MLVSEAKKGRLTCGNTAPQVYHSSSARCNRKSQAFQSGICPVRAGLGSRRHRGGPQEHRNGPFRRVPSRSSRSNCRCRGHIHSVIPRYPVKCMNMGFSVAQDQAVVLYLDIGNPWVGTRKRFIWLTIPLRYSCRLWQINQTNYNIKMRRADMLSDTFVVK